MELDSSLRFRTKKALKAAKKICHIAKKSDLFVSGKSHNFEVGYELTTDTDPDEEKLMLTIGIQFRPKNWLGNTLEKLYGREVLGTKKITYQWLRQDNDKGDWIDVWDFYMSGRELCKDFLFGLHGHKDYESCSCPNSFKKYCREVNSTLKKYSFNS